MKEKITETIISTCQDLFGVEPVVMLERPEEQFGDFSTNVAMQLAKPMQKNPRDIAQELTQELQKNGLFDSVGVAGPGFINITLTDTALIQMLNKKGVKQLKDLTVLVEYSDPNPFKPLHAGHLYTTIIGDVIARLVERAGAKTIRLNYGGDVGLHVAKSMWAIIKHLGGEYPEKLQDIPEAERASWLGTRYVEGNQAYEDEPADKAEIIFTNKKVYTLHAENDRDSAFAHIYWTCREWSYTYFAQLYAQLQTHKFDRYIPESEVIELGVKTVTQQLEKGVFKQSDGAVVFDGEAHGLHTRVFINSEGLPTYETKDVGLSLTKWQEYKFDESIIITANEQAQYMHVILKAIEQFMPEPARRTKHVTHGFVKLAGGVKMSSRKGNTVTAIDILDAAKQAAEESDTTKDPEVVLAAVKYAFLKTRIGGDIIYVPEESIAMEGNSGPYLQYAHARAKSILRKSVNKVESTETIAELEMGERSLVRKMAEFNDAVYKATEEIAPHHICTYLYELSQNFNRFYEKNKVIGDVREATRLALVASYADVLATGLDLLGINAPESM